MIDLKRGASSQKQMCSSTNNDLYSVGEKQVFQL